MNKAIEDIQKESLDEISRAKDLKEIESITVKYTGRKGFITSFSKNLSNLPSEERPEAGRKVNEVRKAFESALGEKVVEIKRAIEDSDEGIDVSLPGVRPAQGSLHPVSIITREICSIFSSMGFDIAEGPEVETDYYNFEALNFPPNHPAREMQDTYYVSENILLRTHTSPMQARVMEKEKPPLKYIVPGKVYRCDSDITHTPMFHQVEGLMVDENISFGDLKGVLTSFIHQIFDEDTSLRFRPSFFPFTEPSAEVDIRCVICRGKGCRVCSQTGWLEILGSGMVHPGVFEYAGYDTEVITGFAFGMGVERIAMLKYGIDDIRKYYENDIRFLGQF